MNTEHSLCILYSYFIQMHELYLKRLINSHSSIFDTHAIIIWWRNNTLNDNKNQIGNLFMHIRCTWAHSMSRIEFHSQRRCTMQNWITHISQIVNAKAKGKNILCCVYAMSMVDVHIPSNESKANLFIKYNNNNN